MMQLFSNRRQQFSDNIKNEMRRFRGAKWFLCVKVKMLKYGADGELKDQAEPSFRSITNSVLRHEEIHNQMDAAYFKICNSLEAFKADGSGWALEEILFVDQTVISWNPLKGSCSLYELPETLKRKVCLLSVVGIPGNSHECFRFAVLCGLFAPNELTGEIHYSQLSQYRNRLSFEGIEDDGKRMLLSRISDFEKLNGISVNVSTIYFS